MKRLFRTLTLSLAAAAFLCACGPNVEQSDQYQSLLNRVDSLQKVNKQLKTNYNETLDLLNEIETGFTDLSEAEHSLVALSLENQGDTVSRRDQMINEMERVKNKIADQQEKIDNLQKQLSSSNAKNKTLAATINRLQSELDHKTAVIADLQKTISSQKEQIGKLTGTVEGLEKDVAGLKEQSASQQATIKQQDKDFNTVSYICGTEGELIEWGLFEKKGLFDNGKLLDLAGTAADFKSFDRRRVHSIPTNGKRIKLLTNHPEGSYTIVLEDDGTESIQIDNIDDFWSISRFLVVRVKR